tara:strand:- start:8 stop:772 length:765 start_codon:yes stop_codon:yes gene_type:complete
MNNKKNLKEEIFKISAITDRGQRLNKFVAPIYQEKLKEIEDLINSLLEYKIEITEENLSGEWELIYSNVELFRSSPFFQSIEIALDNKIRSDLFFKLHQLQVGSFGLSSIGRVAQKIDFKNKEFVSSFDTTIFGLTTIPIIGWFKLLPTFGGRVTTLADELILEKNKIIMKLKKTKVVEVKGLNKIPLFSNLLMDKWYPVNEVWKRLPWNKSAPYCETSVVYLDEDLRIMKDIYGSTFIYIRGTKPFIKNEVND